MHTVVTVMQPCKPELKTFPQTNGQSIKTVCLFEMSTCVFKFYVHFILQVHVTGLTYQENMHLYQVK